MITLVAFAIDLSTSFLFETCVSTESASPSTGFNRVYFSLAVVVDSLAVENRDDSDVAIANDADECAPIEGNDDNGTDTVGDIELVVASE